jgi:hypothetical protein
MDRGKPAAEFQRVSKCLIGKMPYCFGVGLGFTSGEGEASGPPLRASRRVSWRPVRRSCRPCLRASTRAWRRVFAGEGEGEAVSVTAPFSGLGAGVGSAAKTLDSAIKPRIVARSRICFIIVIWGFCSRRIIFSRCSLVNHGSSQSYSTDGSLPIKHLEKREVLQTDG